MVLFTLNTSQASVLFSGLGRALKSAGCVFKKRPIFQSLLLKFRPAVASWGLNFKSLHGVVPWTSAKRKLSAPIFSTTDKGSTTLPLDLDILRPALSRTKPCRYTVLKGTSPV